MCRSEYVGIFCILYIRVCTYICKPGEPIRRFFSGLLLFLVEDQKFLKDTLLVSYCCALVLLFCALVSCFWLCFSTSSLRHVFGRDQKKTSNGGPGMHITVRLLVTHGTFRYTGSPRVCSKDWSIWSLEFPLVCTVFMYYK